MAQPRVPKGRHVPRLKDRTGYFPILEKLIDLFSHSLIYFGAMIYIYSPSDFLEMCVGVLGLSDAELGDMTDRFMPVFLNKWKALHPHTKDNWPQVTDRLFLAELKKFADLSDEQVQQCRTDIASMSQPFTGKKIPFRCLDL
jgi:hypothetical protein